MEEDKWTLQRIAFSDLDAIAEYDVAACYAGYDVIDFQSGGLAHREQGVIFVDSIRFV